MEVEVGSHANRDSTKLVCAREPSISTKGRKASAGRTGTLLLETLRRLVPVAKQQESLTDLGRLESLGHDIERDSLGDLEALAVEVVRSLRVVARGDGAD